MAGRTSATEWSVNSLLGTTAKEGEDSINCVLLDDQVDGRQERSLAAMQMGTRTQDNKVIVRHTTLLPPIPGFPAFLTLMFCPRAEYRLNPERTRVIGAICGLGCHNATHESVNPHHDMKVAFEVDVTDLVSLALLIYAIP